MYAPQQQIRVKYLSELVSLEEDGTSIVTTDCLIENASDDPSNNPIDILRIIYPNRLYDLTEDQTIVVDTSKVQYDDLSSALADDSADDIHGAIAHNHDLSKPIPSWAKPRTLELADPDNPLNTIKFEGIVGDNNKLYPERFTSIQHTLLYTINNTVLTYKFKQPLNGDARWIRLRFKGKNAAHNLHLANHKFQKRIFNLLHYQYQIFGPYDVKKRFAMYLLSYKRRYENNSFSENSKTILQAIDELVDFFTKDGLFNDDESNYTRIQNLFIHVNPGELERLTDFVKEGDLKVAGFLPNIVFTIYAKVVSLYQWKLLNKNDDIFMFSLIFQAKPLNLLYPTIPLVAVSFAATALLLGLYNLFFK